MAAVQEALPLLQIALISVFSRFFSESECVEYAKLHAVLIHIYAQPVD